MILDNQQFFSDAQVLTATGNSTNVVDLGGKRDLGAGEPVKCIFQVSAVSGTAPTLAANLVGADDSAFTVNKVTAAVLNSVTPVANTLYHVGIQAIPPKRYYQIEYTVGGTTPSITVSASLTKDEQTSAMTV